MLTVPEEPHADSPRRSALSAGIIIIIIIIRSGGEYRQPWGEGWGCLPERLTPGLVRRPAGTFLNGLPPPPFSFWVLLSPFSLPSALGCFHSNASRRRLQRQWPPGVYLRIYQC